MIKVVRSFLLLLGLALLPACASSERATVATSHEASVAPQPQPERPAAKIATTHTVTVHFDSGSADIRAAAMQIIYGATVDLRGAQVTAIRVTGYADAAGRRSYNQKLSERRAAAVAAELHKLGLRADHMTVSGAGETKNGARRSQADRRVEITIEAVEQTAALPLPQSAPSLSAAATTPQPAIATTIALAPLPASEPAGPLTPAPLRGSAKPAIKFVPARTGTTWLPPPAG